MVLAFALAGRAAASDCHAATNGSGSTCSHALPCTLARCLTKATSTVVTGNDDSVLLHDGTYSNPTPGSGPAWTCDLVGTAAHPIKVRPETDPTTTPWAAKIDGLNSHAAAVILTKSPYVWYIGLEVLSSYAEANNSGHGRESNYAGDSNPPDILRGECFTTDQTVTQNGVKFINMRLHDCKQGLAIWTTCIDCEAYGNHIYYNGWDDVGPAGNPSHGHAIYTQGLNTNSRTLKANVAWMQFSHNGHAYSSSGSNLANHDWIGNSFFRGGCVSHWGCNTRNLIVGAGSAVTGGSTVNNLFYYEAGNGPGSAWKMGYGGGLTNYTATGNHQYGGTNMDGTMTNLTFSGNTIYGGLQGFTAAQYPNNTYGSTYPTTDDVKVTANYYEPRKCFVTALDLDGNLSITFDMSQCGYTNGDSYTIYDDYNWEGTTPITGTYNSGAPSVTVNVTGWEPSAVQQYTNGPTPHHRKDYSFTVIDTQGSVATPTNTPTVTNTPTKTYTPTATFTPTPTLTTTASKTPTLTPSNTVTSTPTLTASQTPTRTPTPAVASLAFSVSACTATAPMTITANAAYLGGSYAQSPTIDQGKLTCQFNVPATGTYRMSVLKEDSDSNSDSLYFSVNGDGGSPCVTDGDNTCAQIFDVAERRQPCNGDLSCTYELQHGLQWNPLNSRLPGNTCGSCATDGTNKGVERLLSLDTANNPQTIVFRNREATGFPGTKIIYIELNQDLSYLPSDTAPIATPTPIAGGCSKIVTCNGVSRPVSIPCLMMKYDLTNPCIWKKR